MDKKKRLCDTIQMELRAQGYRQKDLADSIGVPISTLNGWLRLGRDIPAHYIVDIATFFECDPMYILTGDVTYQVDPKTLMPKGKKLTASPCDKSTDALTEGKKESSDEIRGISDEGLKVGCLWDNLDEPGKAIILGKIYERLEGPSDSDHADGRGLKRA